VFQKRSTHLDFCVDLLGRKVNANHQKGQRKRQKVQRKNQKVQRKRQEAQRENQKGQHKNPKALGFDIKCNRYINKVKTLRGKMENNS
jgi:hypothetical protein